jgi:hypothetical protein
MFDLLPKNKTDDLGNPVVLSFYGPQIVFSQRIIPGLYNHVVAGMQSRSAFDTTGTADIRVSPLTVTGFAPLTATGFGGGVVPESSTWVMMTLGFAGLAFAGYRTSRRKAVVA